MRAAGADRDGAYQRILNMKNVAGIVKNFDPAKLGAWWSATGRTGRAVLDGQHRLTALRQLVMTRPNCIVLEGDDPRRRRTSAAARTRKQSLRINDTFNASLWAEDAESLRIKELMDKYGFRHLENPASRCASAHQVRCSASCAGLATERWN